MEVTGTEDDADLDILSLSQSYVCGNLVIRMTRLDQDVLIFKALYFLSGSKKYCRYYHLVL